MNEAQAKYHEIRKDVECKLNFIKDALKTHRKAAGDNLHWGHVGDLVFVSECLDEVRDILK